MKVVDGLKRESNNLDLIRIILASFVIFGHTIGINGETNYWIDPIDHYFPELGGIGGFSVKIFFFISGMVVSNSLLKTKKAINFTFSRIFRIVPGLFFILLISSFIIGPLVSRLHVYEYFSNIGVYRYFFMNLIFNTYHTLPGVFYGNNNFVKDHVNGSLWSLQYEMECYLILLGIFLVSRKFFFYLYSAVCIAVIVYAIAFGAHHQRILPFFCFAFGAIFALFQDRINLNIYISLALLLLCVLLRKTSYSLVFYIMFACYSVLLLSVNKYFLRVKVKHDISYGIYLWGYFVQQLIFFTFGHIQYNIVFFALSLFISILMGLFSFVFVEKPGIEFGKRLALSLSTKF